MKNKTLIFISLLTLSNASHLLNGADAFWALLPNVNADAKEPFRPEGELLFDLTKDPYAPKRFKPRKRDVSAGALEEAHKQGSKRKAYTIDDDAVATTFVKHPTPDAVNMAGSEIKKKLKADGVNSELPPFAQQLFSKPEIFGLRRDAKIELNKAKKQKEEFEKNAGSLYRQWQIDLAKLQGPLAEQCQAAVDERYNENQKKRHREARKLKKLHEDLAERGEARAFSAEPHRIYSEIPGPRSKSV